MATYCDSDDIKFAGGYAFVTDLVTNDGSFTETQIVDAAIEQAEGFIDAKVGGRYSVPFTTVPNEIKQCAITLACYNLAMRSISRTQELESWAAKAALWFDWLDRVQDGGAQIPTGTEVTTSSWEDNHGDLYDTFPNDRRTGGNALANNYFPGKTRNTDGT